jgi:hypothetical protein
MKNIIMGVLLLAGLLLGIGFVAQWKAREAAAAEAAKFQEEKEAALEDARIAEIRADSIARALDSIDALRQAEKEEQERRAAILRARANALTDSISEMLPPEVVDAEVHDAVMEAITRKDAIHEEEVQDLRNLLIMTENTLERSRRSFTDYQEAAQRAQESLRRALAASEAETQVWKDAANPSFGMRLKKDALTYGGVALVFLSLGLSK